MKTINSYIDFAESINQTRDSLLLQQKSELCLKNKNLILNTKNNTNLDKALTLLSNNHYSIKEVAFLVGFNSPKYFSQCFKKVIGLTPIAYKKNLTNAAVHIGNRDVKNIFIQQAEYIVNSNLSNNNFSLDVFACEMNVSKSTLFRKLKLYSGLSPFDFIHYVRFKKVEQIIAIKEYKISDIAYFAGYNDTKYFTRCFKTKFGMAPSEFRNNKNSNVG
jgi:AraC-like DNA-binding protein